MGYTYAFSRFYLIKFCFPKMGFRGQTINDQPQLVVANKCSSKLDVIFRLPSRFRAQKEKMGTYNFKRPNWMMSNHFFVCFNDIRNWVVNKRTMSIHQTSCDINALIFRHTLTKSQYQTNRAFNQRKLLEIYIIKFKTTLDEKVLDTKITKPQVKAY